MPVVLWIGRLLLNMGICWMTDHYKFMKLRNILILLLLAAVALPATSQQWELDFGDQNDINQYSSIGVGMIDAKGDAIMVGYYGRAYNSQTQLIKVHPDGSYERRVCEDLPKQLYAKDIVQLSNGNYFTVAHFQPDTTMLIGGRELWAIVFDENLEIVDTKVYTHDSEKICAPCLLYDNGQVIACGNYYEGSNRSFPYMYRFDENADTLACRYVVPKYYNISDPEFRLQGFECYNILKNPSGNSYIFLCNGPGGGIGTVFYDDDFQYVKAYRYILGTPGAADSEIYASLKGYSDYFLSEDRLLLFGTRLPWHEGGNKFLLTIGDLDLSWTVGPGQSYSNSDCGRVNHYEMGFFHEEGRNEVAMCMATVNDTTMYGCYETWYYAGDNTYTGLCLFDRDMEILGGFFFEKDYKYWPQLVLPYSDGGCLLVMDGGESMSPYRASKVLKMTREDMHPIPTSVKEMPHEAVKALAYPNPAKDELHIDISGLPAGGDCRVNITDALGRVRLDRYIRGEGNVLTVGVGGLPAGVYGYRIYNADGEIVGGKFVKE